MGTHYSLGRLWVSTSEARGGVVFSGSTDVVVPSVTTFLPPLRLLYPRLKKNRRRRSWREGLDVPGTNERDRVPRTLKCRNLFCVGYRRQTQPSPVEPCSHVWYLRSEDPVSPPLSHPPRGPFVGGVPLTNTNTDTNG